MTGLTSPNEPDALALLTDLAARQGPPKDAEPAADYDWSSPCSFTRAQLHRLAEAVAAGAAKISQALTGMTHAEVRLAAGPLKQHYGSKLAELAAQRPGCCVVLAGDGGRRPGAAWLSASAAASWVSRLLGASAGGAAADRELSSLESTLVLDIFTAVLEALASAMPALKGLKHDGTIVRALDRAAAGQEEYCEISLAEQEGAQPAISFFLVSSVLGAVAAGREETKKPPEEVRKDLIGHLHRSTVTAWVMLGRTHLTVRDLMALECGDVLLLDTPVGQPVELLVEGRLVATGTPAQSEGQYALQIVRRA